MYDIVHVLEQKKRQADDDEKNEGRLRHRSSSSEKTQETMAYGLKPS